MDVDLTQFDDSALTILKTLAKQFPMPAEVGYHDLFPEEEGDSDKRKAHIGVLAFLRHENLIAHETGSVSSFIITRIGLALFNQDILKHLQQQLAESV